MTSNPYAGTDLESVWAEGYEQGHKVPSDTNPPFPASLEQQDHSDADKPLQSVWLEGVNAGILVAEEEETVRQGQAAQVNPALKPGTADEGSNEETRQFGLHTGIHAVTTAGEILETGEVAASLSSFFIIGLVTLAFATTEVPEGEHASDPAVLQRWFAEECKKNGATELFLAYCKGCGAPGHNEGGGDKLTEEGWWHGRLYRGDHTAALAEAKQHLESDPAYKAIYKRDKEEFDSYKRGLSTGARAELGRKTGLLHYKASNPDMLEMTTLTPPEFNAG